MKNMTPELSRFKTRMSAQERLTALLYARVEDLSQDMTGSFKQLAEYQVAFEQRVDARFDRIEATMATKDDIAALTARIDSMEGHIDSIEATMATKDDLAALKATMATKDDLAALKATMATKDDIATLTARMDSMEGHMASMKHDMVAMEGRILDVFQQLVVMVDKRLPEAKR